MEGFTACLKAAVEKDDTDGIKATLEQLQQALYAAGAPCTSRPVQMVLPPALPQEATAMALPPPAAPPMM